MAQITHILYIFQSSEHFGAHQSVSLPDGSALHLLRRQSRHRMEPLQEPRLLLPLQGPLKQRRRQQKLRNEFR